MSANLLSLVQLLDAVRGTLIGMARSDADFTFTSVTTDSRTVVPGSLFVPLVGEHQDGHVYIPQAVGKGATVVFLNGSEYRKNPQKYTELAVQFEHTVFISVTNTLHALQDAAAAYAAKFPNLIKIGVTGSSGKTTTKEMITALLRQKYRVIATEGNFNSETGLPLSVFRITDEYEVGVFEMGMNRENEIGEIAAVLKPHYALITNIGTAHIGILGSRENIAREKRKIFTYIPADGAAFIPAEDDFANFIAENVKGKVIRYGQSVAAKDSGVSYKADRGFEGTVFTVDGVDVMLRLPGPYNYRDALGAVAIARYFGVTAAQIKKAFESFGSLPGRMEIKNTRLRGGTPITLLKDCYNANPDSMGKVLEFCGSVKISGKKIFVLGDMRELGSESADEHAKVGREAVAAGPSMIIFMGDMMKYAAAAAKSAGFEDAVYIPGSDTDSIMLAAQFIIDCVGKNDVLLLKGSRGMELERLIPIVVGKEV